MLFSCILVLKINLMKEKGKCTFLCLFARACTLRSVHLRQVQQTELSFLLMRGNKNFMVSIRLILSCEINNLFAILLIVCISNILGSSLKLNINQSYESKIRYSKFAIEVFCHKIRLKYTVSCVSQ